MSFYLLGLDFDVHMSIFVSPIVFPLAFSINGEFLITVVKELKQHAGDTFS